MDDLDILKKLRKLDKEAEKLAKEFDKDFKKIERSASTSAKGIDKSFSAIQFGVVAGGVAALTTAFINLGTEAIRALARAGEAAVDFRLKISNWLVLK